MNLTVSTRKLQRASHDQGITSETKICVSWATLVGEHPGKVPRASKCKERQCGEVVITERRNALYKSSMCSKLLGHLPSPIIKILTSRTEKKFKNPLQKAGCGSKHL